MEIRNATIKSTHLGYEDHNIMTIWLQLDYGGSGQGFGGYGLDEYVKSKDARVPHVSLSAWVKGIIDTVGVRNWEELNGKHIRVERGEGWNGKITRIGHFLEDKWFDPATV